MDRDTISALTHGELPFANPLDPAAIDAVAALDLPPGARARRRLRRRQLLGAHQGRPPGRRTIGIEPSRTRGRGRCARGVDEVREVMSRSRRPLFDLVAASPLRTRSARGTRRWRRWYGWTGPAAWRSSARASGRATPTPSYLEALGGAIEDELPSYDGLLAGARDAGWDRRRRARRVAGGLGADEESLIANGERSRIDEDADPRRWVEAARARWNHLDGCDTLRLRRLTLRRWPSLSYRRSCPTPS